jgi:ankyrin repeat protein
VLVSHGVDINFATRITGETPLFKAVSSLNYEVCELLVSKGANVNAKDNFGRTPLDYIDWMIHDMPTHRRPQNYTLHADKSLTSNTEGFR